MWRYQELWQDRTSEILAVLATEKDMNKGKGKEKGKKKPTKNIFTKNIVYKEVLTP
jgi:hypothetical protein